ncbi:hypothetical protein CISIN_1g0378272mg, partial [Citrus sinensis]
MCSDEVTTAQEESDDGNNKTPNTKDEKIIKDIANYKQVTRYLLEDDWKGLEDYIMSKTPNALACIIVDQSSIFEFIVASTGKLELISTLIRYEADLPNVRDEENLLPIHRAAKQGQRNVVCYLLEKTRAPLDGSDDVAYGLLRKHPKLAWAEIAGTGKILELLSKRPKAFASGIRLGYWKGLLYQWIPVQEEYNPHAHAHSENVDGDLEKQLSETSHSAFG